MPALQVRDFPDDLYEQLRIYAASEHRSIAQQTIVAVEQMLEAANASHYWDGETLHRMESRPRSFDFDTEAKRAARIQKRKELFEEIGKIEWSGPQPTDEDIVAVIHEGREERDRAILEACGMHEEVARRKEAR